MALIPVRPLYSASATATNGSDIIQVTGNVDCSFMSSGSIVSLGTRQLTDAISGTAPDLSGNSTIKLRRPWSDPTTTAPLLAFMSREGLADAVARLRQIIDAQEGTLQGAFSFMGAWDASSGNFPPAPGEGLGSQMYRVSVAGTMGGRAYRVGEPLYYDQFTSQWRSMLGLATAFSTGLLASANAAAWRDELGLVPTTSANDTTAGRLLKVGDFGNGLSENPPIGFDFNSWLDFTGVISPTLGENMSNAPYSSWGALWSSKNKENAQSSQLYISNDSFSAASLPRVHIRTRPANGTPTTWCELYHNRNILGTVTQFGGTPTGAIIQRGSNASGEFVRFADGTQICRLRKSVVFSTTALGNIHYNISAFGAWNFPVAFSETPFVSVNFDGTVIWGAAESVSAISAGNIKLFSAISFASETINTELFAIGRWF